MTVGEDSAAVPAPRVVAHWTFHLVTLKVSMATRRPRHFRAALLADLKFTAKCLF